MPVPRVGVEERRVEVVQRRPRFEAGAPTNQGSFISGAALQPASRPVGALTSMPCLPPIMAVGGRLAAHFYKRRFSQRVR
jgi:hypothetical protein